MNIIRLIYFVFVFVVLSVCLKHSVVLSPTNSPEKIVKTIEVQADTFSPDIPVNLNIPSIGLNTKILPVSLTPQNLVDVPNEDVGWYQNGPKPGEIGSASLDGHFVRENNRPGIFHKLSKLKVGDDIYITDTQNQVFHFKVIETDLINTTEFPVQKVYGPSDKKILNLVTCAGEYDQNLKTFNQRTIVYSELINR